MESTLSSATSLFTLSKTLRSSSSSAYPSIFSLLHCRRISTSKSLLNHSLTNRVLTRRIVSVVDLSKSPSVRGYCAPKRSVSVQFSSGGGGGIGGANEGGGGGGGGGDGADGGAPKVAVAAEDVSALSPDAIVLDVTGMTCGGCAAKVKKILENQTQVSSANVNLATETAIVWPISEAKDVPNWREELGAMLAKHLTNCGFESNLRGRELAVSWALCAVCMFGSRVSFLLG
ncbi:Copper-transporting ATPase PAA1 chloroplastic [Bienertia sinuspersici]